MLEKRIAEGINTKYPTIFVEGPSDKTILDAIIRKKFPKGSSVKVLCSQRNGGGHAWVKDSLIAWHHSRPEERAIGLFDGDAAAFSSLQEFSKLVECRSNNKAKAFKHQIKADGIALEIVKSKLALEVAIEELCPIECWNYALSEGWLENRSGLLKLYEFKEVDITFNDWIAQRLVDVNLRTVATQKVGLHYKEKFATLVAKYISDPACSYEFKPLERLVDGLLKHLHVEAPLNESN